MRVTFLNQNAKGVIPQVGSRRIANNNYTTPAISMDSFEKSVSFKGKRLSKTTQATIKNAVSKLKKEIKNLDPSVFLLYNLDDISASVNELRGTHLEVLRPLIRKITSVEFDCDFFEDIIPALVKFTEKSKNSSTALSEIFFKKQRNADRTLFQAILRDHAHINYDVLYDFLESASKHARGKHAETLLDITDEMDLPYEINHDIIHAAIHRGVPNTRIKRFVLDEAEEYGIKIKPNDTLGAVWKRLRKAKDEATYPSPRTHHYSRPQTEKEAAAEMASLRLDIDLSWPGFL